MWSAIRWLVLRLAALRWIFKLGGLGFLIPIALLLKTIGLPVLMVLAVLALPILLLLFLFGLPIFLVLLAGGAIMGLVGMVLTIGIVALKIGIFIVLPIWLCVKVVKWISCGFKKRRGDSDTGPSMTTHAEPVDPEPPQGDPLSDNIGGADLG